VNRRRAARLLRHAAQMARQGNGAAGESKVKDVPAYRPAATGMMLKGGTGSDRDKGLVCRKMTLSGMPETGLGIDFAACFQPAPCSAELESPGDR